MNEEDFKYIYETYFEKYDQEEFDFKDVDGNDILFEDEVISVLKKAYNQLKDIKDRKININQYERDIKRIEALKDELQEFSEEQINIQIPQHPSQIFYHMNNYLMNTYKIPEHLNLDMFKILYDGVYDKTKHKKPKRTKRINSLEESFFKSLIAMPEITEKWKNYCNQNKDKSLQELIKTFSNK